MGAAFNVIRRKKLIDRATRYVLKEGGDQVVRFSLSGSQKKVSKTKILNISDTGMAFSVDGRAIPHVGEIIKIELQVNGRTVRYGRVVRLESPQDSDKNHDISVAVEFVGESSQKADRLNLNLETSFMAYDRAAATLLDRSAEHLLLVSGFLLVALFMGL